MSLKNLIPSEIVKELDKYIVGQIEAKEAVAIALRNRIRRKMLPKSLIDEVTPKNIIMIGPTGIGKTEIARRLAKLVGAPFIKVEATKFTEVGYVGKDVDSMIRDLVQAAVELVRNEKIKDIEKEVKQRIEERILNALLPSLPQQILHSENQPTFENDQKDNEKNVNTKEKLRERLRSGQFEDRFIDIEVEERSQKTFDIFSGMGIEGIAINLQDMMDKVMPERKKRKKIKISEARIILRDEEIEKLIDMNKIAREAIKRAEELGIVFIDEIDKIAMQEKSYGPDVSRSGVQRDILPIIEGSTVLTKYGSVKTDHILFIAAGAFNVSKPSDLIPELQGRFPLRVNLNILTQKDLKKILVEPDNSLIKQYHALLRTEGLEIVFKDEAIEEIARIATVLNEQNENIGARRLYTVLEKLLDRISFNAEKIHKKKIIITKSYVNSRLQNIIKMEDLSKYIL